MSDKLIEIGSRLFAHVCGVIDSERDGCPNSAESLRQTIQEAIQEAHDSALWKPCETCDGDPVRVAGESTKDIPDGWPYTGKFRTFRCPDCGKSDHPGMVSVIDKIIKEADPDPAHVDDDELYGFTKGDVPE